VLPWGGVGSGARIAVRDEREEGVSMLTSAFTRIGYESGLSRI
jgi:hypothetical protein